MNQKKVLITGGSRGIGLAIAKKFSENNYQPIIIASKESSFHDLRAEFPNWNFFACDLSREDSVQEIYSRFPDIDVLVNNAGIQINQEFGKDHTSHEKELIEINTNLISCILLIKKYLPILKTKKESSIVNVTSGLALVPKESAPIYCATKAALRSFSISLRWQLENLQPKVIEVLPPLVDTDMTRGRGRGKISPSELAIEFWDGFVNGKQEIYIGKSKILYYLHRIYPSLARRIMRGDSINSN